MKPIYNICIKEAVTELIQFGEKEEMEIVKNIYKKLNSRWRPLSQNLFEKYEVYKGHYFSTAPTFYVTFYDCLHIFKICLLT